MKAVLADQRYFLNDPIVTDIVSEFETQEQAESYDRWFRAKVQEALLEEKRAVS